MIKGKAYCKCIATHTCPSLSYWEMLNIVNGYIAVKKYLPVEKKDENVTVNVIRLKYRDIVKQNYKNKIK